MKNLFIIILLLTPLFCKADYWTRKADFPGGARSYAYSFAIGNKAYVGGGYSGGINIVNDLWEYNPTTNLWTQKANTFFYSAWAMGFSIGNKGYVCCGNSDSFSTGSTNLYEYDPILDTWTHKAIFPGSPRSLGVSFVIGTIAYVVGGDLGLNDFYGYDQSTNTWITIDTLPPSAVAQEPSAFAVGNKGYVTNGLYSYAHSIVPRRMGIWEYDPSVNTWMQKADFPDTPRADASTFAINNKGYFGVGDSVNGAYFKDWWQYNPITDSWIKKSSIPCAFPKDENNSFSINNKGYIVFGGDNNPNTELWEYTPDPVDVQELNTQPLQTKVSPNPFSATTTISFSKELHNAEMVLTDIYGKEIAAYKNINGTAFLLHRNNLAPGLYFYSLKENGLIITKDKIVVQ